MCTRHDVGRMKDRESQKTDEGIGIGIYYWNRKRWILDGYVADYSIRCEKRARVTVDHPH